MEFPIRKKSIIVPATQKPDRMSAAVFENHRALEACALWFTVQGAGSIQASTLAELTHVWAFAERIHVD
ncbi:MAG: hypothetical protein ACYCZT_05470 [Thiobacillus sp.]